MALLWTLLFQLLVASSISAAGRPGMEAAASKGLVQNNVHVGYHMGPVLSVDMEVYIVWYGTWQPQQQEIIREFILSISDAQISPPSTEQWWGTVRLYNDQTGLNVTGSVSIGGEHYARYSHGRTLTRLGVQDVLRSALRENNGTLPVNPRSGAYLVLSSEDVSMQEFCRAVCGFHYFTFPSIVGYTLPYAWIGNSAKQCPDLCAFPFVLPAFMKNMPVLKPPNGDIGIDAMVNVIGHELAEMSTNPLINAWYAGNDPTAPTEIADLCQAMYGNGAGSGFPGDVLTDKSTGGSYNLNGVNRRKYLVQWIWNPLRKACYGPNA